MFITFLPLFITFKIIKLSINVKKLSKLIISYTVVINIKNPNVNIFLIHKTDINTLFKTYSNHLKTQRFYINNLFIKKDNNPLSTKANIIKKVIQLLTPHIYINLYLFLNKL